MNEKKSRECVCEVTLCEHTVLRTAATLIVGNNGCGGLFPPSLVSFSAAAKLKFLSRPKITMPASKHIAAILSVSW